jgi:molybdopterin molybdotransferase
MISVAEALAKVLAGIEPVPAETVGLADALGRVLAADVAARLSHPPKAVSAMDGYAVRAADVASVPAKLQTIGESSAGAGFKGRIEPGTCVRIFTGAPVPDGADAIVIQEDVAADGGKVAMNKPAKAGEWIRPEGLDFRAGEVLLKAGVVLSARDVGLAAAMNVPWLQVRRRPRIAIIATGNEVVWPGDPVGPDQIVSSNSVALAAYVRVLGGEPINLGIAPDEPRALLALIDAARGADLLVTSGGASVGDYDLVREALGRSGFDLGFYKVAMRPGKPLIFGRLAGIPVLGLPGNPVSAGVCAAVYLKPAMEKMLGLARVAAPEPTAILGRDLPANDRREDYMRAALAFNGQGEEVATPFPRQDSAMMANFARADCLVVRPPEALAAKKGERVRIIRLRQGPLTL